MSAIDWRISSQVPLFWNIYDSIMGGGGAGGWRKNVYEEFMWEGKHPLCILLCKTMEKVHFIKPSFQVTSHICECHISLWQPYQLMAAISPPTPQCKNPFKIGNIIIQSCCKVVLLQPWSFSMTWKDETMLQKRTIRISCCADNKP